jgi:site-specific DNA-methyltransferase (adenine-specific)
MSTPYYSAESVEIHLGDCREVLPALGRTFDAAICDPPYGFTKLTWDRWPTGWTRAVGRVTDSMWCFGSLRMFMVNAAEFAQADWRLSHDVIGEFEVDTAVWEKHNGSGFQTDRIRCVHELASHWYQGAWADVRHEAPVTMDARRRKVKRASSPSGTHGERGASAYKTSEGGPRLLTSVIRAHSEHGRGIHSTQKPVAVLTPLIGYAVPPGGTVLDPMAGSCSTAVAARLTGRHAVCIEADEAMCERAARRLDQNVLPMGDVS